MRLHKVLFIVGVSALLFSCGGSKKVVSRSKKPIPKRVITRTTEEVKPAVKEDKRSVFANLSYKERVPYYVYEYAGIAKAEMKEFGIPASITLAQGILESGAGAGDLSQRANNHFGIKCHDWTGERVFHDDDRRQECFRKYDHAETSFRDHSLFLSGRKRYASLFKLRKDDYKSWAKGLRKAGYATDVKYPAKLISIIERYQLYKYDNEVLGKTTKPRKDKEVIKETNPTPIKQVEGVHVVEKGDTLYSISRKYKIKVADLKAYNGLKDNGIQLGQVLKTKPTSKDDSTNEF